MADPGPNLLVPIDLRALVATAGAADQTWADLTPRYGLLDAGVTLGDQLAPAPFTPLSEGPEPGVHLHWAMPDALTHGTQEHNTTSYPKLPNRWLVARLWRGADDSVRTRAWVLLSDALSDTDPGGSTPWPPTGGQGSRSGYLGRVIELGAWDEDAPVGDALPELTAVGPGDPLFAASYWSCRNVFAMHDRLEDVQAAALTYVVIGWWSAPESGPLAGRADWRERLLELGWSVPPATTGEPPADTLLHGMIHGVRWEGPDGAGPTGVPQGPVQVSVGNTTTEALAAMLAAHVSHRVDAERLLQAFLDGLLPQFEGPDGLMVLEELMHQGEFAPADGGTGWDIVPAPGATDRMTPRADALTPLDPALAEPLETLNEAQRDLEAARWHLASLRQVLYGTWHKKVQLDQSTWPDPLTAQAVTAFITGTLLPEVEHAEGNVRTQAQAAQAALETARTAVKTEGKHELHELPRPRFWQPRPPVAVLSGPGVERSYRHGFDGRYERDGTLRCRLSGMQTGGEPVVPALPARLGSDGPALFAEAAAISPALPGNPGPGTPPSPAGVVAWAPPWTPLMLQWETQWRPTADAPADALHGWELGEIDFRWAGGDPFRAPARRFSGQAPLDPATSVRLSARIDRYLDEHPDDPLRERLKALGAAVADLNVVSQSLSGFNSALLGTLQTLQLPVVDTADPQLGLEVAAHVGPADEITPDPSGDFEPLRAGNLLVSRLAIVDTFGQVKPVGVEAGAPPPIVAEALRSSVAPRYAQLPPRISQPTRLRFEWQPVEGDTDREATSDPATTPIAGWLLPNHIDASLMLYDADGGLQGELQLIEGSLDESGPGVRWLPAAGTPQTLGVPPKLPNATLADFAAGLTSAGQRGHHALRDLLATIDETLPTVDALGAWKDQSLSILVGRPLALARARVWLELQGMPAFAQTWAGLEWLIEHGLYPTEGFTSVRLPVVLGDTRRLADGLIGFFAGEDYSRFHLARHGARPPRRSSYVVPNEPLQVSADPDAAPVEAALVLDPRAAVHASCAFLPADSLSLSADFCAAAQAAMEVTFLTGPIVSDPARISLPVPASPGRWTWLTVGPGGAWNPVGELNPVDPKATLDPTPQAILDGWLKLSDALAPGARR